MNFFGTDGIRGTYGSTITDGTAFLLGKCLAQEHQGVIVVVGRDTRKSGDALFNSLLLGVYSGGGNCINLGILPTNSVGHFTRKLGADFGVMISASHNPPKDNGLKVFDRYGVKLCEPMQLKLSANMEILLATVPKGKVHEPVFYDIENIYCEDIMSKIKVNLHGINIALDCCYGASYRVGKTLFNLCGANVSAYCDFARGQLINVSCGATHTEFLQGKVEGTDCDLGFAFDGDCDRLAVFERDRLISPDRILYLYAKYMSECGLLNNNIVVGTVLTNGGVAHALKKLGLTLSRSDVGDTNVFIKMMELSSNLGGENSGHYLLSDYATSSDALINALMISKIYREKGSIVEYTTEYVEEKSISVSFELTKQQLSVYSQNNYYADVVATVATPNTRVVIRPSGTESKVRAYVEGEECEKVSENIKKAFYN